MNHYCTETVINCYCVICFTDEDDFPALTKAIRSSQPNYWADRHAFVKGARPKTEDEEAEMIRLALEASQLEEAERQQKILEEENQYKFLLYVLLFFNSTFWLLTVDINCCEIR